MTPAQLEFLKQAAAAARAAGHAFPEMAACEAALESAWGRSGLAVTDHNLFGMKQHRHPVYGTHVLPTREFEGGMWRSVSAAWVSYPDVEACFADRMNSLRRLAAVFPHYKNALTATDAAGYVREVSRTWSTDPARADKVIAIFNQAASAGAWDAPNPGA